MGILKQIFVTISVSEKEKSDEINVFKLTDINVEYIQNSRKYIHCIFKVPDYELATRKFTLYIGNIIFNRINTSNAGSASLRSTCENFKLDLFYAISHIP